VAQIRKAQPPQHLGGCDLLPSHQAVSPSHNKSGLPHETFIHSGKLYSFHVELYSPLHNLGMKNNTLGSAVNGSKLFIRYEENFPLQQTESVGKQTQTARCNSFHASRINTARQTHPQIKFMSGSFSHRTFAITFLSF
jgi:hypothetical protein